MTHQGWFHSDLQRWDYRVRSILFLNDKDWQSLGDEGWELVAIHGDDAYFKRPQPSRKGFKVYAQPDAFIGE